MKKILALTLGVLGTFALVGCGGSSGGTSTVLMGSVTGDAGTTSGVSLKASVDSEGFSRESELDGGNFSFSGVPEGVVEVEVSREGETNTLKFDVTIENGTTTELDLYLMTWTPEAVAEFKSREGDNGSFGDTRPAGPTGTTMTTETDGSRKYTTPKGLDVTRKPDGTVEVDSTNYTP